MAKILRLIGCLSLVSTFIAGILLAETPKYPRDLLLGDITEFSWIVAMTYWIGGFVACVLMFGFAEAISLLQQIYDKMDGISNESHVA